MRPIRLLPALTPCATWRTKFWSPTLVLPTARCRCSKNWMAAGSSIDPATTKLTSRFGPRVTRRHAWIFRLLPNEKLNSELGRQIQDAVAAEPREDAFRVLRNIFFRGRLLKHGGFSKASSIRLFRKNAVQYELRDGRAEVVLQSNKVGELASRLSCELCLGFERSLSDLICNAQCMAHDGLQRGHQPTRRRALGQTSWQFTQSYLLRMGWLDGWAGLHASCLSAFATYLREAMLWDLNQPAVPQRIVVRDSWQGLKLFDPAASDSVASTFSNAPSQGDEAAATSSSDSQVLRPAA